MPHKCTKCGREFEDGSTEILRGCPSCGGKKFLFVKETDRHRDVLEEKNIESIAKETKETPLEVKSEPKREIEVYDRVESIRVLQPGSYELNIEKLAKNDEVIVRLGHEDRYAVDIISMAKDQKTKDTKKRKKK